MVQELLHLPQLCSNSQCHYSIFSLQGFNFTQLKVISIDFFVDGFSARSLIVGQDTTSHSVEYFLSAIPYHYLVSDMTSVTMAR